MVVATVLGKNIVVVVAQVVTEVEVEVQGIVVVLVRYMRPINIHTTVGA